MEYNQKIAILVIIIAIVTFTAVYTWLHSINTMKNQTIIIEHQLIIIQNQKEILKKLTRK